MMYKSLINNFLDAIRSNERNVQNKDVRRSIYTAGMAHAYAETIRNIGHDVTCGSFIDNECIRIAHIKIDQITLMKNGEWNSEVLLRLFETITE